MVPILFRANGSSPSSLHLLQLVQRAGGGGDDPFRMFTFCTEPLVQPNREGRGAAATNRCEAVAALPVAGYSRCFEVGEDGLK